MKNILTAAAMIILTALVVLAAANFHNRVHNTCSNEWTSIYASQHGLAQH